ncbi:MFS transporter [Gaoshiqia sediminis]|uniref:MFS transporter n=1 Tax=Gaoshiqia sediminis TaxID=2986998 RepID=A0AA42C5G0_9BACT|nr:MFS transporter [Gaoshiqia sediminis]MCW0481519.1 MFS transporter [Gaoshiqia sediminis]
MKKKPVLSFWQIWNMSFGFLGIQFGFALQNANVSRIFQSLGGDVDRLAVYWLAAPVTGLIVQPIIGHYSDKTWGRFGRRRPYFLIGAILASLALFIMPNSPMLWIAVGTLWIMDASINISMEPFRAFVGDMLPSEQRTKGFAMQSFFIGTGAIVASFLPYAMTNWFGVANVADAGHIPPSVKWSFYIGGAVFFLAVLWTVVRTKEYSPEELQSFEAEKISSNPSAKLVLKTAFELIGKFTRNGIFFAIAGAILSYVFFFFNLEKELYILSGGLLVFGLILLLTGHLAKINKTKNGLVEIVTDMMNMPKTMRQLAIVQFFSWFALFAMWIYTTAGVTSHVYGTSDTASELYNEGANWVGVLFGVYNGFAAVVAFLLPVLAKYTNRKITHAVSLVLGGIGLASFYVVRDPNLLILSMLGVGVAWASILSMPYAILTGSLPGNKMGTYMGIFNFFIVIPQILAASILGFFMKHVFGGQAIMALLLGGASMLIAAVTVLFVDDIDSPK